VRSSIAPSRPLCNRRARIGAIPLRRIAPYGLNKVERPKTLAALARFAPHLAPVVFRRDGEVTRYLRALS